MPEQRWVFVVQALDKPGTLTAAAAIFSNRGVSLQAVLGSGIASTSVEDARLILSFSATVHQKQGLLRALQRLANVVKVDVYSADNPQVRSIAVAKVVSLDQINLEALQTETISQTADHLTVLMTGQLTDVEAAIDQLRQQNALRDLVLATIAV